MGRKMFEDRKRIFKETIMSIGNLPRTWMFKFEDGEDQRVWFDKLLKTEEYKDFIKEVEDLLSKFGKKIVTDKEKEEEFYEHILLIDRIPMEREYYFSDNSDMRMWYMSYKDKHEDFETKVHDSLSENTDLDLEVIWSDIKEEFFYIIKTLGRIPRHNEKKLQCGIDVRTIYDRLETFDTSLYEKINLHLATYKKNTPSTQKRTEEFLTMISKLGYIPELQEARFSDNCDMLTWYERYKTVVPELEEEVSKRITKTKPVKKVNIYLIPNFKNKGGKFYTICSNTGEVLDLSEVTTFEEAQQLDSTLVKRGGLILKQDEEIETISKGGRR